MLYRAGFMSDNNMVNPAKTNWARVDAMTDAEIDTSDSPVLTEQFFSRAKPWLGRQAELQISATVDPAVAQIGETLGLPIGDVIDSL
jgi:hypothetical protein